MTDNKSPQPHNTSPDHSTSQVKPLDKKTKEDSKVTEINGPKGLEPTRYGDWESKGRCYDF